MIDLRIFRLNKCCTNSSDIYRWRFLTSQICTCWWLRRAGEVSLRASRQLGHWMSKIPSFHFRVKDNQRSSVNRTPRTLMWPMTDCKSGKRVSSTASGHCLQTSIRVFFDMLLHVFFSFSGRLEKIKEQWTVQWIEDFIVPVFHYYIVPHVFYGKERRQDTAEHSEISKWCLPTISFLGLYFCPNHVTSDTTATLVRSNL